jgi:predicted dehydrogenase
LSRFFPVHILIAGIGGFAEAHHRACWTLENEGIARVVASCDPAVKSLGDLCTDLRLADRGVQVHRSFAGMLESAGTSSQLGIIASPIHTHALIHHAFVQRGIPCYMEKPPTLDPMELHLMIERDASADIPTNVGFAHINSPAYLALKQRIVDGEFGPLRQATLLGMAPRARAYFKRNDWAGRLFLNENLVLDSCLGNAMSHFLNSSLFFAGTGNLHQRARPVSMEAELYRANSIEGTDTIFAATRLDNGAELRIAATHASEPGRTVLEQRMEFERASVSITSSNKLHIAHHDGRSEIAPLATGLLREALLDQITVLSDPSKKRVPQSLQDSVAFVETHALFYMAAHQIHSISIDRLDRQDDSIVLPDFESVARKFLSSGDFPSRQKLRWASPGGFAPVESIANLRSMANLMRTKLEPKILLHP